MGGVKGGGAPIGRAHRKGRCLLAAGVGLTLGSSNEVKMALRMVEAWLCSLGEGQAEATPTGQLLPLGHSCRPRSLHESQPLMAALGAKAPPLFSPAPA